MHRRTVLTFIAFGIAGSASASTAARISLYKSPTCGCCGAWVDHLRKAKFDVAVQETADLDPVKRRAGVPAKLHSCHTAFVGDYVVEGHVPAEVIARLLVERPSIRGLAVPDMPIGSPGMEVPGEKPEPFDVLAFDRTGATSVFASYPTGYPPGRS